MVNIASPIRVLLDLDKAKFEKGLKDARKRLERFGKASKKAGKAIAGIGTAITGAVGAFAYFTKGSLDVIDKQAKLARQAGASTAAIQRIERAAELSGLNNYGERLKNFNKALANAQMGSGNAAKALERLNLDASELAAMDIDDRLIAFGEAMDKANIPAVDRIGLMQQLQIEEPKFLNLIENGAQAVKTAREEFKRYGIGITDLDASRIEEANDSFSRLWNWVTKIRQDLAIASAPFIDYFADRIDGLADDTKSFVPVITELFEAIIRGVVHMKASFEDAARGLRVITLNASDADKAHTTLVRRTAMLERAEERLQAKLAKRERLAQPSFLFPEGQVDAMTEKSIERYQKQVDELRAQVAADEANAIALGVTIEDPNDIADQTIANVRAATKEFEDKAAKKNIDLQSQAAAGIFEGIPGTTPTDEGGTTTTTTTGGLTDEEIQRQRELNAERIAAAEELTAGLRGQLHAQLFDLAAKRDEELEIIRQGAEASPKIKAQQQELEAAVNAKFEADRQMLFDKERERHSLMDEQHLTEAEKIEERRKAEIEQVTKHKLALFDIAQAARDQDILSEEEYQARRQEIIQAANDAIEGINEDADDANTDLTKKGYKERFNDAVSATKQLTTALGKENKAAFLANKGFQIAEAIKDTWTAVNKTYAKYGWPLGAIYGGLMAAAGFANVRKIASTSFSGGGSTGGGGTVAAAGGSGSAGARAALDQTASVRASGLDGDRSGAITAQDRPAPLDIRITGVDPASLFSGEQVATLIESINDQLDNGAVLRTVQVGE